MASNHLLSITSISEYFKENLKQLKRGEIAYKDNHILKFQADPSLGIIVGEIKPSMRNDPYNVKLFIKDGFIADAQCSCPRGTLICHHIAALAIYTHYNLSSTDTACSWSVRKSNSLVEIKTIKQIHNCIPCPDVSVSNVDFDNFRETLVNLSVPVGFSWLLQPETESITSEHLLVDSIESLVLDKRCQYLVNSKDFVTLTNYVKAKMYVTDLSIIQVAKDTVGQINNDLWYKYRKNRLTASHFGQVLAA